MSKKIYLIREYGGEYEDSWERIEFAYLNKENRDKKLAELNERIDGLEKYREMWVDISSKLDAIDLPEDYCNYINDFDVNRPEIPEYENYVYYDSFERFVYWMNKVLPELYNEHTEDFWKSLYDYYEEGNAQYGSLYTSYFDAQEVEISDAE